MLRVLAFVPQAVIVALVGYNLATALAGWKTPAPRPVGSRRRRFVVAIPAHDEETVIGAVVEDLLASDYSGDLFEITVIADRCGDRTAAVARAAGVLVEERFDGPVGKGAALGWFLGRRPLAPGEALVVIDADNRVPGGLLARLADELDAGATVAQVYLDTSRPDETWITLASAMSYWAGNRMVQLARSNLGWSADLGGTGMCLTAGALDAVGGFGDGLVEDQDLAVRLALAGIPVIWIHDQRIRDEKPATVEVAVRQRARWAAGRRAVARRYFGRLLRSALSRRRWALVDQALRLVQPSRTVVAALSGLLALVSGITRVPWLWPWWVWAGLALVQFLAPVPFLLRDGVPARRVARYPIMAILALLWLPVQVLSRRRAGWYHTPHRGEIDGEAPPTE